jgi:DNA-binding CsgD family transcriptional regulator
MFSQEKLKKTLSEFLDRRCRDITRQELALELGCTRDDVIQHEEKVEDILIEIQEDKAVEDCKKVLKKLVAKGVELTPESLADYLGISVKEVKEKKYVFDQAVAEFREAQAVA